MIEKIKELFSRIDEIDREIEEKIELEKKLFREIKEEFDRKIVPEIERQLKLEVKTDLYQDIEDPTWIDLRLVVWDNQGCVESIENVYEREDEIINKVYVLLDKMLSKEIADRIVVIPIVKNEL